MKLSIIIPVYNVEKYIKDCILSCIENIGYHSDEVEVIIVDDGSQDRSIEIAKTLIKNIPYFRFLSQKNMGLSLARNNGLDAALGDYVWFVDSDDIISNGIVSLILEAISKFKDIDLFELQYKLVDENVDFKSLTPIKQISDNYKIISGKECFVAGFNTPVPFHVFKRAFLNTNGLRMYPRIYHEDSEFTPRAVWIAKNIAVLPEVAYYYRQRDCSIMTTTNPQKEVDYLFVSHRLHDYWLTQEVDNRTRKAINDYVSMIFCNGLHNLIGAKREDRKIIERAAYEHKIVLNALKGAIQFKYRLLGMISSIFPNYTAVFYLLLMKIHNRR